MENSKVVKMDILSPFPVNMLFILRFGMIFARHAKQWEAID